MHAQRAVPRSIDAYIAAQPVKAQAILRRIRRTIARAAPAAQETISYRIPTFTLNGALVYFAAFKAHIGLYPPLRGDARLEKALAPYAGAKGNLKLPLDQPIPYGLIARFVKLRVQQKLRTAAARRRKGR